MLYYVFGMQVSEEQAFRVFEDHCKSLKVSDREVFDVWKRAKSVDKDDASLARSEVAILTDGAVTVTEGGVLSSTMSR